MHPYLKAASERVVIGDGAFGTHVQSLKLQAEDFGGQNLEGCNEILCLTRPEIIKDMHRSFLEVGSDFVTTATFGAFQVPLAEYDIPDQTTEINLAGARLAKQAADEYSTKSKPRWVAGSIGPGTKTPTLGQISYDQLKEAYREQTRALLEGGVDFLLIETVYDLLSAKAAVSGARQAMQDQSQLVPIQLQVTIETTGRMLLGTEITAAIAALDPLKPDVLGLNCATGPAEMGEHLRVLSQSARMPISCIPNAGLPHVEGSETVYDLSPEELGEYLKRYVSELGVSVIGGCCGTTTKHLSAVIEACANLEPAQRNIQYEPSVSSIYSAQPLRQDISFLMIGERTNATGSKKFRDFLQEDNLDACVEMGTQQISEGAHLLDLNVDSVGRDGPQDMTNLAKRFATEISIPVTLDSTEPEVLEAGLKWFGGRAILNSANLEDGDEPGSRADRVFRLAKEFGTAVICLLIDEEGQARDLKWKMRIAKRLHDMAVDRYGLEPQDLIFDTLVFPLTTGDADLRDDAKATIQAISAIKEELPKCYTSLGISNVSFGIKPAARAVLNSVFLDECLKAGLDAAIVHAGNILPLNQIPEDQVQICRDLIWNKKPNNQPDDYDPLTSFLDLFEDIETIKAKDKKEPYEGLSTTERLSRRIIDGNKSGLDTDLDEALSCGLGALEIVNDVLLKGMKEVGELFGAGKMQLPFVLKSAETMKAAVKHLEPHMEKTDQSGKGQIILATVQGDVHDIGKNLVDIILTNNGYIVHNLGIKVSVSEMIEKALETEADAIGMSGLLVKSTLIMKDNLEELNARGLSKIPVLLGGAALTRKYVEQDLREVYEGQLFYGKDAFEGLKVMEELAKAPSS